MPLGYHNILVLFILKKGKKGVNQTFPWFYGNVICFSKVLRQTGAKTSLAAEHQHSGEASQEFV